MKLISSEEARKFITNVENIGGIFDYKGAKDPGVWMGAKEIPFTLAQSIINDIDFPLDFLDVDLIIMPFRLMQFDFERGLFTGGEYNGRAYPTHIIYGARHAQEIITKESVGDLFIHEIGHSLMYKQMNCDYAMHMKNKIFKEYIKLRRIPSKFTAKSTWEKRPAEIFAEDFRYLFGDKYMSDPPYDSYKYIDPPKDEIKQFMLNLLK